MLALSSTQNMTAHSPAAASCISGHLNSSFLNLKSGIMETAAQSSLYQRLGGYE
jgi:hypothetical protein